MAAALLCGCYGGLVPNYDFGTGGGLSGPGGDGGDADDGDAGGDDGGKDVTDAPPVERAELRRLTKSQYAFSLEDLFGSPLQIPAALEPDLIVDLFATVGAAQGAVSSLGAEQYEAAADDVADQIFDDTARRSELVGCDPATPGCVDQFIATFGRRAFRRPLTDAEIERYVLLAEEVGTVRGDAWEGAQAVVVAMLSSPSFLYLVELGEKDPEDPKRWRFTSLEMASRLSYAIWNSPPDEELLEVGESGDLVDPDVIREQAARLIADPKARRGIRRFASEWLALDPIAALTKDTATFPDADDPELFVSMQGETVRLAEEAALEGSMLDLVVGDYTFVDAKLASHYGIAAPADVDDEGFGRVDTKDMDGRTGILGTAGVLAMTSRRTRTAPTLRGLYVQSRLRCNEPPPPPAEVPMDIPDTNDGTGQTIRELLEEHRSNPTCAACHAQIDPPGLALEHFDAMGAYRTQDAGLDVDATTEIEDTEVDGLAGLAAFLAQDKAVSRCIVRQLHRFTLGHREVEEEEEALNKLAKKLAKADYNLPAFIPELMAATSFRTRKQP